MALLLLDDGLPAEPLLHPFGDKALLQQLWRINEADNSLPTH
jgi:hypothetical protein